MAPVTVPAGTPLHEAALNLGGISLITYNVLLPNSGDGWWVFKYYDHAVADAARTWSHRQGLLHRQLLGAHADVVCLQETSAPSFATDFGFLLEAGYDARLHRKYRFRPATLFRTDRLEFVGERHTDRALVVVLRQRAAPRTLLGVVNVHLAAAPDPRRRFRQVFDAPYGPGKPRPVAARQPADWTGFRRTLRALFGLAALTGLSTPYGPGKSRPVATRQPADWAGFRRTLRALFGLAALTCLSTLEGLRKELARHNVSPQAAAIVVCGQRRHPAGPVRRHRRHLR